MSEVFARGGQLSKCGIFVLGAVERMNYLCVEEC